MAAPMSNAQAAEASLSSMRQLLEYHAGKPLSKRAALALSNTASAALVYAGTSRGLRSLLLGVAKGCLALEAAPAGSAAYAQRAAEDVQAAADYLLRGQLPAWLKAADFE